MNIDLTGKTAIVTGSTGGIGLAVAQGLSQAGAAVIVCGRQQQGVDKALRETRGGAQARGVVADLPGPTRTAGAIAALRVEGGIVESIA